MEKNNSNELDMEFTGGGGCAVTQAALSSSGIDGISEFQVIPMAGMSHLFAGIALWVPQNPAQDFRREQFL